MELMKRSLLVKRSMHLLHDKAFINNQWVSAQSTMEFIVTSPETGNEIGTCPDMTSNDAEDAIQAAHSAYQSWQNTTGLDRSFFLQNWYHLMVENREDLASLIIAEGGKPVTEALNEVDYGNSFVEFYAEEAKRIHGQILSSPFASKKILVERQPIGVVGLITPWNFPHALLARKAAAALAAGCTCVIKPSEDTPLTALALMELAQEAGIPMGVLNVVTSNRAHAQAIGNLFCQSPLVAGISFTGSTKVGKLLYKDCSSGIKRIGLELGGDAPFIVYSSANLETALEGAMVAKFRSCGQTCVAPNRFFIHNDLYDEFSCKLVEGVQQLKMGDLHDPEVNLGPLINQAQFDKVSSLVQDAIIRGAQSLTGGRNAPVDCPLCYEPTILTGVTEDMKIYKEEVFGPVVNLLKFESEEESIKMANDTRTGLASYIFSEDVAQIFRVTKKLEVGMCGVNTGAISMAEIPFGGIKESGLGREGSHYGIDEFTYVKYICLGKL